MKKLIVIAALALSACAAPFPIYDNRVWDHEKMKEVEMSPRQVILAELECKELTKRHEAQIMFGNFGGWETTRVFVHCMEARGYKFVNADAYK